MKAFIREIEYHLPTRVLTNDQLAAEFPEWTVDKIEEKTGFAKRHIADEGECASDLGVAAAEKILDRLPGSRREIDYLLFCTQSPDYFLPTTACIIQERLGLPETCGALDYNLGCSGYVFGLGLAKGLIETGQARNVLLITGETYTKYIHPGDRSVRTLFGDAGAATLIQASENGDGVVDGIGPFEYGTDGSGAKNLIVPNGGLRSPRKCLPDEEHMDEYGNVRSGDHLYMNGSEILGFTLKTIPDVVIRLLSKAGKSIDDVDLFVFHQANKFMLEHLRRKIGIPEKKFFLAYKMFGNTVSCSIPIALRNALDNGRVKVGDVVMLVGFGVGYSWGATLITLDK